MLRLRVKICPLVPLVILAAVLVGACNGSDPAPTPGPLDRGIAAMTVTSPAYDDGQPIPSKHTCQGKGISPPLELSGVPPQTRSLALIMDDPQNPSGPLVHWLAFSLDPGRRDLNEGLGKEGYRLAEGRHGVNDFGNHAYHGPCPPFGETRTYRIMAYALDRELHLKTGATVTDLLAAMRGNVLGLGTLEGFVTGAP